MSLCFIPLQEIPLVKPGDDLGDMITGSVEQDGLLLQDGDILVIAQKIVSKSEDRLVNLSTVLPSKEAQD